METQKEKIVKKFFDRFGNVFDYTQEHEDFWLNELDLAIKETEERIGMKMRKEVNTEIHKEGQSKERVGGLHKARAIVANIFLSTP